MICSMIWVNVIAPACFAQRYCIYLTGFSRLCLPPTNAMFRISKHYHQPAQLDQWWSAESAIVLFRAGRVSSLQLART
jgi:Mn2+/Fe2+ NRAMP family transporter